MFEVLSILGGANGNERGSACMSMRERDSHTCVSVQPQVVSLNDNIRCHYSHLHNSVNTEISFFGRDVTYLPKKDSSHVLMAMLMALDNHTQQ